VTQATLDQLGRARTAAVIITGDEVLRRAIQDRNGPSAQALLEKVGISTVLACNVGDDTRLIKRSVELGLSSADIVVTIGGLGPTMDDVTKSAVADAVGLPLQRNEAVENYLLRRCAWSNQDCRGRLARLPAGALPVYGLVGGVPGFCVGRVLAVPGVPNEMREVLGNVLAGRSDVDGRPLPQEVTVETPFAEHVLNDAVRSVQEGFPQVQIGVYTFAERGYTTNVVFRSRVSGIVEAAASAFQSVVSSGGARRRRAVEAEGIRRCSNALT
jgi:molybdenum cofactor synthesis domain-containing protein